MEKARLVKNQQTTGSLIFSWITPKGPRNYVFDNKSEKMKAFCATVTHDLNKSYDMIPKGMVADCTQASKFGQSQKEERAKQLKAASIVAQESAKRRRVVRMDGN